MPSPIITPCGERGECKIFVRMSARYLYGRGVEDMWKRCGGHVEAMWCCQVILSLACSGANVSAKLLQRGGGGRRRRMFNSSMFNSTFWTQTQSEAISSSSHLFHMPVVVIVSVYAHQCDCLLYLWC